MARARQVQDDFAAGASPYWTRLVLGHGEIERGEGCLRLVLEPSPADGISDAQIHDYFGRGGDGCVWVPPLHMAVRARFSRPVQGLVGTAGFGLWNNPFTVQGEVVAPPNNAWFFFASRPSAMELVPGVQGWGWKAAVLDGGWLPGPAMRLAQMLLQVPVLRRILGRLARTRVRAAEAILAGDLTAWHTYELRWLRRGCTFWMDGVEVLTTSCTPTPPLGFVAWVDNQYAVARPDGYFLFGRLAIVQRQWLELDYVRIQPLEGENAL
jgi:hypothetical protein